MIFDSDHTLEHAWVQNGVVPGPFPFLRIRVSLMLIPGLCSFSSIKALVFFTSEDDAPCGALYVSREFSNTD